MSDYLDKFDCNYEKLFIILPHTKNKEILQSLEEIYNDYQDYKKEFIFFDKALWQALAINSMLCKLPKFDIKGKSKNYWIRYPYKKKKIIN